MPIPPTLHIVTLGVADLPRAEAFYAALGWPRAAASSESIVWFKLAGSVLGLFPRHELAQDSGVEDAGRRGFSGVTLAVNVESPEAVDAALLEAVRAGGSIARPGTRATWGGYFGYFGDPDGHLWEVAHNPFFPIGEDGLLHLD